MAGWWPWWWSKTPLTTSGATPTSSESSKPPAFTSLATPEQKESILPTLDASRLPSEPIPRLESASANVLCPLPESASDITTYCTFVETYGRFTGICLVVASVVGFCWIVLLTCINIAPRWAMNTLFRTQDVDDGEFWLPSQPNDTQTGVAVASLVLIALYYSHLLWVLLWKRKLSSVIDDRVDPITPSCSSCLCDVAKQHFGALDEEARPYLKVSEELPELVYQTLLLHMYMRRGLPSGLVFILAGLISVNCFARSYRVLARERYHELHDSLANYVFQYIFAVVLPLLQLGYAAGSFGFDRGGYELRLSLFQDGAFERLLRFAQPNAYEVSQRVTKRVFELLVLGTDPVLLIGTCGLHLGLLWRWKDITSGYLLGYKKQRLPSVSALGADDSCFAMLRLLKAVYGLVIKILLACLCVSKRFIPRLFAMLLALFGAGIMIVTSFAVTVSTRACQEFQTECLVHAFEFTGFATRQTMQHCPCLVYVDQPREPMSSWSQWVHRESSLELLTALAQAKRLEVVQIVNKELVTLPSVLQDCEHLRELVLIRTSLAQLPAWLLHMEELQLLHISGEADPSSSSLSAFPVETMFLSSMKNLRVLRLEEHANLTALPAFPEQALSSLTHVILLRLPKVTSIPVLSHVTSLRSLVVSQMRSLQRLPQLPPTLKVLRVEMDTALCCNGYLGDGDACSSVVDVGGPCAAVDANMTCLTSDTLTSTQTLLTQQWMHATAFECALPGASVLANVTEATVLACDGVLHRECSLVWPLESANVSGGMCLGGTSTLEVVHCAPKDARYEALRRAEIARAHSACDPEHERWLGCERT